MKVISLRQFVLDMGTDRISHLVDKILSLLSSEFSKDEKFAESVPAILTIAAALFCFTAQTAGLTLVDATEFLKIFYTPELVNVALGVDETKARDEN